MSEEQAVDIIGQYIPKDSIGRVEVNKDINCLFVYLINETKKGWIVMMDVAGLVIGVWPFCMN